MIAKIVRKGEKLHVEVLQGGEVVYSTAVDFVVENGDVINLREGSVRIAALEVLVEEDIAAAVLSAYEPDREKRKELEKLGDREFRVAFIWTR